MSEAAKKNTGTSSLWLAGLLSHIVVMLAGTVILVQVVSSQIVIMEDLQVELSQPVIAIIGLASLLNRFFYLLIPLFVTADVFVFLAIRTNRKLTIAWIFAVISLIVSLVGGAALLSYAATQ